MSTDPQNFINPALLSPWKWLLGLALLGALVAYVHFGLGWQLLWDTFSRLSMTVIGAAFTLFVGSHLLRALRIYELIVSDTPCRYTGIAKLSALHQFANNLLPMRLGEVVLPWLLRRHFGTSWQRGFARLIWLRLLDLTVMGIAVLFVLVKLGGYWPWIIAGSIGLVALVLLARQPLVIRFIEPLRATAPQHKTQLIRLFLWTILAWLCKLSALALLVIETTSLSPVAALAGTLGGELSSILPVHGVAGAGSYEVAFLLGLSLAQVPTVTVVAVAVTVHLFVLLATSLVAIVFSPVAINR